MAGVVATLSFFVVVVVAVLCETPLMKAKHSAPNRLKSEGLLYTCASAVQQD